MRHRTLATTIGAWAASLALTSTMALTLGACTTIIESDRATAVWELAPQQQLDATSTEIAVLVTRLGCNSGVTGTVNEPTVELTETEAVITFTVSPGPPEAANCQGNDQVPYVLTVPRGLDDLTLIDGACASTEARTTVYCETDIRHPL